MDSEEIVEVGYQLFQPPFYTWVPKEDITALEVARLVPFITLGSANELYRFLMDHPQMKRHFIIED